MTTTTGATPFKRARAAAFLLYTLTLVTLTHDPQVTLPDLGVQRPDLVLHLAAYGLFGALLTASAILGPARHTRTAVRALLIAIPFAVIDEATQAIPGLNRFVSLDDLLANWLGITIAIPATTLAAKLLRKLTNNRTQPHPTQEQPGHTPTDATQKPDPTRAKSVGIERAGAAGAGGGGDARGNRGGDARGSRGGDATGREGGGGGGGGFVGHARTFAGVTVISRIFGLARDALCAAVFGASPVWSAFVTAFIIPNILRRLFGEGSLAAAFIPVYTTLHESDPHRARKLALVTVLATGAATALIAIGLAIAGFALLAALPPDPPDQTGTRTVVTLALLMLPFMPTICMTAVLGAMLQTHGRFVPGAAAPILLNAAMISAVTIAAVILGEDTTTTARFLAASVAIAGITQTAWCLTELKGVVSWSGAAKNAIAETRSHLITMLKRLGPVILGLGTLQLALLIDTLIAGWPVLVGPTIAGLAYPLDKDAAAVLYFAQRLYQLPVGVFVIALASAIFPALARLADRDDDFTATLRKGLRVSAFIGAPAAAGLAAVAPHLVRTIYGPTATTTTTPTTAENPAAAVTNPHVQDQLTAFTEADAQRVTAVTIAYAAAIVFVGLTHTATRAFYAKGDTTTPMKVSIAAVAAGLALNLILIWPLAELGLAVASAAVAAAQAAALLILTPRILRPEGSTGDPSHALIDRDTARSFAASAIGAAATAAAALAAATLAQTLADNLGLAGRAAAALALAAAVAAGALAYAALARLTRRPELTWLLTRRP